MKFCTNCGAQIPDGSKFCTECGQKLEQAAVPAVQEPVAPVAAPAASAAVHVYGQPVNHSFSEPVVPETEQGVVHTYGAPVNHGFAPPVQAETALSGTYGGPAPTVPAKPVPAPAPEPVAVPVRPEPVRASEPAPMPAAQPAVESGSYTPPVATEEKPPKAPRVKSGGKKLPKPVIIGVAVVAVLILLVAIFGGGGDKNDPNLGLYNGVSSTYEGMELGAEGEWIELKSGGKATLMLMGDEYSAKWKLDGENLTVTQAGDDYYGTLKNGVLVLDLSGVVYTYEKEGAVVVPPAETKPQAPATEPPAPATEPPAPATEPPAPSVSAAGYWTLLRADSEVPEYAMDEETVETLRGLGIEIYLELKEDGTGTLCIDEAAPITWSDGVISDSEGYEMTYSVSDGQLIATDGEVDMIFIPGQPGAVKPPEEEVEDETEAPAQDSTNPILNFWEGDWYGWWVVWDGEGTYDSWEDSAWDAYAHIEVNDDYTGTVTLWEVDSSREDPIAVVDVSFRTGVSEYGCMVSESGWFMDCEVGHADWNLDVGASMVRMFDKMIAIDSYYYEPENNDNGFNYVFILRPWGMDWEDVRGVDADGTYYSDMMPIEYDSWYLPLINKGVAELPDSYQAGLDLIG